MYGIRLHCNKVPEIRQLGSLDSIIAGQKSSTVS